MKRVEKDPGDRSGKEVSQEGISLEDVIAKVEVELDVVPEQLVEEDVSAADTIAFVEAQHALTVEALDAFQIVSVDRSTIRLVKTCKSL
jgi:hypothetical protein